MVASSVTGKPKRPFSACYVTKDKDDDPLQGKDDPLLSVISSAGHLSDLFNTCSTTEPVPRKNRRRAPKLEVGKNASKIRRKTISKSTQSRNPAARRIVGKRRKNATLNTDMQHPKTTVKSRVRYTSIKKLIIPLIRIEDLPLSQLLRLIVKPNYVEKIPGIPERKIHCSETTKSVKRPQHPSRKKCKRKRSSQRMVKVVETFEDSKKIRQENPLIQDDMCTEHQSPETDTHIANVKLLSTSLCTTDKLKRKRKRKDISDGSALSSYEIRRKCVYGDRRVKGQSIRKSHLEETNASIVPSIEHIFNNNYYSRHQPTFEVPHVIHDEHIKEIEREMRELKLMTNGTSLESTCNAKMETFSETGSNLDATQLSEKVLKYFLEQKKIMTSRSIGKESEINTKELPCIEGRVEKILAMCLKCKQVLHLLQQLRDKVNFRNGETLSVECTLCNLHINSLYNLQQHLMDIHLQCDGKLSSTGEKFPAELVNSDGIMSSKSIDTITYECCCCPKACNDVVDFREHMDNFHSTDIVTKQIAEQITTNTESSTVSGITKVTSSEISTLSGNTVLNVADKCDATDPSNENAQIRGEIGSDKNVCTIKKKRKGIKNRMSPRKSLEITKVTSSEKCTLSGNTVLNVADKCDATEPSNENPQIRGEIGSDKNVRTVKKKRTGIKNRMSLSKSLGITKVTSSEISTLTGNTVLNVADNCDATHSLNENGQIRGEIGSDKNVRIVKKKRTGIKNRLSLSKSLGITKVTSSEISTLTRNTVLNVADKCDATDPSNENVQIRGEIGSDKNVRTVKKKRTGIKNRMSLSKSLGITKVTSSEISTSTGNSVLNVADKCDATDPSNENAQIRGEIGSDKSVRTVRKKRTGIKNRIRLSKPLGITKVASSEISTLTGNSVLNIADKCDATDPSNENAQITGAIGSDENVRTVKKKRTGIKNRLSLSKSLGITKVTSSEISTLTGNTVLNIADNCDATDPSNENAQIGGEIGSDKNVCTVKKKRTGIKNRMSLSKSFVYFKDKLENQELSSESFSDFNIRDSNALMETIHDEKKSSSDSDINYNGKNKTLMTDSKLKNIFSNRWYSKFENTSSISATKEFILPNPLSNDVCGLPKKLSRRGGFPYTCTICHKKFRKKNLLLPHVKKHVTDTNCDMSKTQNGSVKVGTSRDTLKPNGGVHLPNSSGTSEEGYPEKHDNDTKLNSFGIDINLGEATKKCSHLLKNVEIAEINKKETPDGNCAITKNILAPNKNKMLTRHYASLSESSMDHGKKLESTMLDVNCEIKEDVFLTNSRTTINLALNQNEVNKCCLCNKKFDTQRSLTEHRCFVHDTNLDNEGLSNLLTPYLNEAEETKNVSVQEAKDSLQKVVEAPSKLGASEAVTSTDDMNGKKSCEYGEKDLARIENNRKWQCDLCKENFTLHRNYLRHKYHSHDDESDVHVCSNCNKVLTSVAMVNIHTCTNITSWNCARCDLDFPDGSSLTRHNVNDHYEVTGPHTCDVCSLTFLTRYMMDKHRSLHDISDNQGIVNNVIRNPVFTKIIDLPPSLTVSDTGNSENQIQQTCNTDGNVNNSTSSKVHQLPEKDQTISKECSMSNTMYLSDDGEGEEQFKCMLCNLTCVTRLRMKLHLAKQHNVKVDICRLCNNLYVTEGLASHLINRHIVLNDYNLNHSSKVGDTNDTASTAAAEDAEVDLVKVLGFKRLLSLYEYQRFNDVSKNEPFNCPVCSNTFSNVQQYRRHYLETHDMMCLLCNIQFKHTVQAMDHKIKSHISIDSYLWVVQKIIAAILQLDKNGNTIDDIILKFNETGSQNDEKYVSSKKQDDSIRNFDIEIPELLGLTDWNATIEESIQNNDLLLKIAETENASEIPGSSDAGLTNTDPRYTSYNNGLPLINVSSCHVENRNLYETCYSNSVDEPVNGSMDEGQVAEDDKVSPVVVAEDALRLDKDNINTFVSQSRSTGKIFPEEYLTKLLTDHIENTEY